MTANDSFFVASEHPKI